MKRSHTRHRDRRLSKRARREQQERLGVGWAFDRLKFSERRWKTGEIIYFTANSFWYMGEEGLKVL